MNDHWIYKYLTKKWTETYDCFAHFAEVQENEFNIKDIMTMDHLPKVLDYGAALQFAQNDPQITDKWESVDKLEEGDAVIFSLGPVKFHIGTYVDVDGGGVLHCCDSTGVTFSKLSQLRRRGAKMAMKLRYRRIHD